MDKLTSFIKPRRRVSLVRDISHLRASCDQQHVLTDRKEKYLQLKPIMTLDCPKEQMKKQGGFTRILDFKKKLLKRSWSLLD